MKRIDTHTHPKMSKHFPFDPRRIARMVSRAKRVGLDGLALTEHFHGAEYWRIHDYLQETHSSAQGVFWIDGLAVIPGAEVNIREGAHVVVLGDPAELRGLDEAFPERLSRGYEPPLRQFLDVTDDFDVVRIGAHMFRRGKELGKFPLIDLRRLHALEVNGKDFGTELMLVVQARVLRLPVVAGSDAHHWLQLGVRHTLMPIEHITLASVRETVKEGSTGYGVLPRTRWRVRAAKSTKTVAKLLRKWAGGTGQIDTSLRACGLGWN